MEKNVKQQDSSYILEDCKKNWKIRIVLVHKVGFSNNIKS